MSEGSRRVQKVTKEIRQVASSFLVSHLNEPDLGLVSVTEVRVSSDLRSAKIFLSFIQNELSEVESLQIVQKKAPQIQKLIASQIRMKFCPKIQFLLDRGIDQSLKISALLKDTQGDQE